MVRNKPFSSQNCTSGIEDAGLTAECAENAESVIPAKAVIQSLFLDPGFRRGDESGSNTFPFPAANCYEFSLGGLEHVRP